jgi:hypothetical protein
MAGSPRADEPRSLGTWLDRPISGLSCVLGWCVATCVFVGLITALGGVGLNDAYESVFTTWAISHGQLRCAYPAGYESTIAPLYPLVSGAIAAVGRIGHSVPFPPRSAMGPRCDTAFLVINSWSLKARATESTVRIGYASWFPLMAGIVAVLRASGRGHRRWEPAILVVVACLPPVWLCVENTFHPQDLMALGFALAAAACVLRRWWIGAGVLIALAILSQQYALLVAAPLLVLAPARQRFSFGLAAAMTLVLVTLPLLVANVDAAHAILIGTGDVNEVGGSLVWELGDKSGLPVLVISRLVPLAVSAALGWWAAHRLGPAALTPVPLLALLALCLSSRLVFDQQLFGYYYLALAVTLVLLDAARGHIRVSLVAWLSTVSMVYQLLGSTRVDLLHGLPHTFVEDLIPLSVACLGVVLIVRQMRREGPNRMLVCWVGMIAAAVIVWNRTDVLGQPPAWLWQIILVSLGITLALGPLLEAIRSPAGLVRSDRYAPKWAPPPSPASTVNSTSEHRLSTP